MTEKELAVKIQPLITIDTSSEGNDLITVRVSGVIEDVPFSKSLYDCINNGSVTLPDGTKFNTDALQVAFENAFIEKTGKCVVDYDYTDAGCPTVGRSAQ